RFLPLQLPFLLSFPKGICGCPCCCCCSCSCPSCCHSRRESAVAVAVAVAVAFALLVVIPEGNLRLPLLLLLLLPFLLSFPKGICGCFRSAHGSSLLNIVATFARNPFEITPQPTHHA